MKLIAGCWVSGCLVFGMVCTVLAESPISSDFDDRISLRDGPYSMAPVDRSDRTPQIDGVLVWDNGGFVTHPGAGFDGTDISMASENENTAGANVRQLEDNEFFRIADRFEIVEVTGIVQVSTFGYEPFEAPPAWVSRNLKIWSGAPGESGSEVIFVREYDSLDVVFTGVYRILHLDDFSDVRRPIYEIRWDVTVADDSGPLWLGPGQYWIDWQVFGGETGWSVYVMEPNPDDPDQPSTVLGDALQFRPIGWTALEAATPFSVFGISDELFRDRFEAIEMPKLELSPE